MIATVALSIANEYICKRAVDTQRLQIVDDFIPSGELTEVDLAMAGALPCGRLRQDEGAGFNGVPT